jgi:hypothetical protein
MHRSTLNATRTLVAFVVAASVAYIVASLFYTTNNLLRLGAVGAEISTADAVRTILFDLRGMAPSFDWTHYGSSIFIGFAIAFVVAAGLQTLVSRSERMRNSGRYLYPLAGATAIVVILVASYSKYEVYLIPGARGVFGVLAQCAAGAIGGALFYLIITRREARS